MDKKLLRKTIVDLKPGDIFSIVFAGQMESQTGKYEFVSQRTGRGKGGRSKLMKAKLVDGNVEVEFGTPHSSYIASITSPDGEVPVALLNASSFIGARFLEGSDGGAGVPLPPFSPLS